MRPFNSLSKVVRTSTHKDLSECFPLWCEEQPNGAEGVFKTVSSFIETHTINNTNKLFEQYDVQKHIDVLHGVVTEARARRQRGETPGADRWRGDLQPREAVRAQTTTTLERERDLLRARLAQMEKENMELYGQIKEHEAAQAQTEARIAEMFAFFDEIYAKWQELPLEDLQTWTLLTAETQSGIKAT